MLGTRSLGTVGVTLLSLGLVTYSGCGANGETRGGFEESEAGDNGFPDGSSNADGGGDSSPLGPHQPCVHNDDCTGPNLCSGTNGMACLGGFCVATNKPMNCDDGILCTNDSCDVNQNKCVHTANDAACPNNSYCDPLLNCVQSLPCTPGDSVCDRLDTTACDGLWACDGAKKLCVRGAKPCADRPNASTSCTATGASATCSWACKSGFKDTNGDINASGPPPSNGCECTVANPNDVPEATFADANCDGIDGDVTKAVFVDVFSGNDGNPGTMALPKQSIGSGIAAANAAVPKKSVYISKGTYGETVTMADGVSLYGAYDAAAGWSRAAVNTTTIASAGHHRHHRAKPRERDRDPVREGHHGRRLRHRAQR